jgi:predicted thioesterase
MSVLSTIIMAVVADVIAYIIIRKWLDRDAK